MNFRKYIAALFLFISVVAFAQDDNRSSNEKFVDANTFMEDHFYNDALVIWLDLLKTAPDNSNINSKVGECYFHLSARKKSLPYFEKASVNISKNYNPFDPNEKNAKIDSYYYLARNYQLDNKLDKAIEFFNKFIENAGRKHYLSKDATREIEMCNYAKETMKSPINIKIESLGGVINSKYEDYGPVVSLDEQSIYFTSRRLRKDSSNQFYKDPKDGMYFEDIYSSVKDNDHWTDPTALNINKLGEHTSTIGISGDGQTLYMYMDDNGVGNLYKSTLEGLDWSMPKKLGSNINSESNETHVTVSTDEKTLYFVSDRKKGNKGGKDIYFCNKLPNGEWALAQPLSDVVNTAFDEDGPYIHPNGKTLYFSSRGHQSMGGYDIFYTEKKDDGSWTAPTNIGYPINTTDDDVFYVPSPDGKRAYYSSIHEGGFGGQDIYRITQSEGAEALTLLKGYITVKEGEAMPDNMLIIITDNETGQEIARSKPLKRNGSFVFIIPPGKNYNLSYEADNQEYYNENIFVPLGSDYNEINKGILLNTVDMTGSLIENPKKSESLEKWKIRFSESNKYLNKGLKIKFLDAKGTVLFTEVVAANGEFKYHELAGAKQYILQLDAAGNEIDCEDLKVLISNLRDPNTQFAFSPDNKCNLSVDNNIIPTDLAKEIADAHTSKNNNQNNNQNNTNKTINTVNPSIATNRKKELLYEEYFTYNSNTIGKEKAINIAVDKVIKLINKNGKVNVAIESSASRVPTKTYGSNTKLTKLRAQKGKDLLIERLTKKGVDISKVKFTSFTTLVQGPKYKGDFKKNKSTYEKYQYVKIFTK